MKQWIFVALLCAVALNTAQAQYKARGFKAGTTIGWQKWNGQQRQPLLGYHGVLLTEQVNANGTSVFGELGYHLKGSSVRTVFFNTNGDRFQTTLRLKFHNVGLAVGGKKRFEINGGLDAYYSAGVRLEYTVADSLDLFANMSNYLQRFNYGALLGAGMEFPIGKANELFIEFSVNPDFSQQIYMPPGVYYNRYTHQSQQIAEQRVINIALELSVGFKFLRA